MKERNERMMKKWKKYASLFLAGAMMLGAFTACTSGDKGGSASTENTGENGADGKSDSDSGKSGDKKKLEFWHIQTIGDAPDIIQASVDRFVAENPEYEVNVSVIANDSYKQKLSVAMSSGQMPDVFISWGGGPMNEYVDAGNIIDLTSYMEQDNYKDQFLDAAIAQSTYQDKIYAVPVENVAICGVFYNKDLFAEYGLSEPKTLTELEAMCETIKSKGKTPFSLANKTQWTGSMYFMNFATRYAGVEPFKKAISGEGSFEDPAFEYAGTKIQEWVDKEYFNVGFNGADEDSGQSRQLLYTEDAAMTIMGNWFFSNVKGENPEFVEKIGFFTFPAIEEGTGDPNIVIGTIGDNLYHISSTCENPDGAFKMIQHLLDETAVQERLAIGRICPLKDITLDDPVLQLIYDKVKEAPDVQLWYDQSLPPEVSQVHKNTSQEIFGKTMTPAEADKQLQDAMQAYLSQRQS